MGLLSLGTYVRQQAPGTEVEILDGRHATNYEIAQRLDGDIVGFGPSVTSYRPALRMAEKVKSDSPGSSVVFGGPYVTPMSMTVLLNRPFIDAVVVQDGEEALDGMVHQNGASRDIPNLTYHGSIGLKPYMGAITKTPRQVVKIRDVPFPDVSLLGNLEDYWKDFWKAYPQHKGKRIVSTVAHRGCPYRAGPKGGCLFCSRFDSGYRLSNPVEYARYVKQLEETFGAAVIEEGSDDFAANRNWLRRFAEAYEQLGLSVEYRIFARTDSFLRNVEHLRRINTRSVFFGYESGDAEMLGVCNKGLSLDTSLEATRRAREEEMDIVGAFILGFPRENERSVQNTIDFAQRVTDMGVSTISYSVLTPLPPSPAWQMMMKELPRVYAARLKHGIQDGTHYGNTDLLDPVELQRDFVNAFCDVDYAHVTGRLAELGKLGNAQTGDFIPE